MALPTSTIVMAVLTAVPFGLAIKDTVTGTSSVDLRSADEREADEASAAMERAQHEYEEQEQKQTLERTTAIEKLIPMTTKGVLGLPEYALKRTLPTDSPDRERLEQVAHAMFTPLRANGTLHTLTISFPQYRNDENICLIVSERLEEAWGSSSRTYSNGNSRKHYASTRPHQRVTFIDPESDRCELVLEDFVDAPDFITKTESSIVPVWAIGKSSEKLLEKLGVDDVYADDSQIRWNRPGVGEGLGGTELYARIVKHKIVTITAKFQASETTIGAVAEKLVTDFGEPSETDPVIWKKAKLSLATVDETAGDYLFVAGDALPEEE